MIKGVTKSGFKYETDERIVKDWRFVKSMAKMNQGALGQMEGIVEISSILLGENQEILLEKHIADSDGYIDAKQYEEELTEIITSLGEKDKEIKN